MSDGPNHYSDLVHRIAVSAQTAIQAGWAAVLLLSEDNEWFITSADTRPDSPFIRLKHNSQVPKWLETQDAVLRSSDPFLGEPAVPFDEWDEAVFDEHGVQLAAPIMDNETLAGVLLAGNSVSGNAYPVSSLNYFKSVADVAGLAIVGHAENSGSEISETMSDDQLLRRMAHDLKGPLATVMTYLDLVRQNKPGNLTESQITHVDRASRSGRRLLRLLNDFVDFARLRSGNIGLDRTEFDISGLAADVTRDMMTMLSARGQELRCTASPKQVTIWADRMRLNQIVAALVSNASRYSADGMPVDLELWAEGNRLRVRVVDQGRGMSEDQLATVFEPFDPGQPSSRSESDQEDAGSGLGLVLARGLVRLHGGDLSLKSATGKGTVAEAELPVVLAGEGREAA